ncbi:TPA: hypothetical protein N0F65_002410 [Lagenidium giganteum]|uniref:Uncharacterized protein n=1 Tax=Lagenidium giganteum TaxID=4803 RepID=A0AAV2YNE3_9STRA|nr:TPA: hypothetical protein N0F65_002410 [Lagenidium giganteum]
MASSPQYKRGHSLYVTPSAASKALMKRQESSDSFAKHSNSQHLWSAFEATRRHSRLLDESKRKEMWHDIKKAEETVSHPHPKNDKTAKSESTGDKRLDDLIQTLRSEITSARQAQPQVKRSASVAQWSSSSLSQGFQQLSPVREAESAAVPGPATQQRPSTQSFIPTVNSSFFASNAAASTPSAPTATAGSLATIDVVSRLEYEKVLNEKRLISEDLEAKTRANQADKESIRALSEKTSQMNSLERENKYLKEETQKHLMQELSSQELVKTLREKLSLIEKSEEQLKLQTRQLMQQNQSLQADLLDKIAAETSKIQKMAHLTSEKQKLIQELQRKDSATSQKEAEDHDIARRKSLKRLILARRQQMLRESMSKWHTTCAAITQSKSRGAEMMATILRLHRIKSMAAAFGHLKAQAGGFRYASKEQELRSQVAQSDKTTQFLSMRCGLLILSQILVKHNRRLTTDAFYRMQEGQRELHDKRSTMLLACTKLCTTLTVAKLRSQKYRGFGRWKQATALRKVQEDYQRAKGAEKELAEAKECVFSLSRAKARLEEKLALAAEDAQHAAEQLSESKSELLLVKHCFVTEVVRNVERMEVRGLFNAWRTQTELSIRSNELRLQAEMAEVKATEREKYAKSVEDYNRVLRNDLERFQFFSQDKRIAVDVLTKKLLREEEKIKQMEEQQVVLEEKNLSLKNQLNSFVEWEGLVLPLSILSLSKDIAIGNIRELFLLHSTVDNKATELSGGIAIDEGSPRVFLDSIIRMLEYSNVMEERRLRREELIDKLRAHLPPGAEERGMMFPEFVSSMQDFLNDVFQVDSCKPSGSNEKLKGFWSSLLALVASSHGANARGDGNAASNHRSSWAGKLSDDILQNQEKLLAVLEHETAVVERAVLDKSSMKITYPAPGDPTGPSSGSAVEYQCDPLMPPDASPGVFSNGASTAMMQSSASFGNWQQLPQVRDLFLSFQQPLLKVLKAYSSEKRITTHHNQFCLQLSGVFRMVEDMKLFPAYLPRELIHHLFGALSDRDGLLSPQPFMVFLGSCALEMYAKSRAQSSHQDNLALSAREVLLSFFCDLGFFVESQLPARTCFVGGDIETIMWPLFEYYARGDDPKPVTDDDRLSMNLDKFKRFMNEVGGGAVNAEVIFRRVVNDSRRGPTLNGTMSSVTQISAWRMFFDDFYLALSYVQEEQSKSSNIVFSTPGEAVRHWMQQSQ